MSLKLVMCGNHIGGKAIVEAVISEGYRFDHFVCLTPEQAAAHRVSGYFDFRPMAEEHGIPVYIPKGFDLAGEEDLRFFEEQRFDILIQGGWQRLFPKRVLEALTIGSLGYHGSADFLPKGRGRSPLNWSLVEGKSRFIMHLFLMKEGADNGGVIDFFEFDITPFDDIETLYFKYGIANRELVVRNLPKLERGEYREREQLGAPSYYSKRTREDGRIDWENMDVVQICNLIRACTRPYPGAFGVIDGVERILWKARLFDTRITYPDAGYGKVVERFGGKVVINCRSGLLLVDEME